jgi:hypothetical protein
MIMLHNTTGDWLDYWWQTQKGTATAGNSGSIAGWTYNQPIISDIDGNDYGIEVHFGQADGEGERGQGDGEGDENR